MEMKVMRLVNPSTGLMECRVCRATHFASTKPGTGSWQCPNGCKVDEPLFTSQWATGFNGPVQPEEAESCL